MADPEALLVVAEGVVGHPEYWTDFHYLIIFSYRTWRRTGWFSAA